MAENYKLDKNYKPIQIKETEKTTTTKYKTHE